MTTEQIIAALECIKYSIDDEIKTDETIYVYWDYALHDIQTVIFNFNNVSGKRQLIGTPRTTHPKDYDLRMIFENQADRMIVTGKSLGDAISIAEDYMKYILKNLYDKRTDTYRT